MVHSSEIKSYGIETIFIIIYYVFLSCMYVYMCIRISCSGTPYHDVLSLLKSQPGFSTDDVDGLLAIV